jgi:streptogramin lyase
MDSTMNLRPLALAAAFVALAGWGRPPLTPFHKSPAPSVTGNWTLLQVPGILPDGDGMLADKFGFYWLTARDAIVHLAPNGQFTIYSTGSVQATGLAMGADDRVYSTGCCTSSGQYVVVAIDQIHNTVATYPSPSGDSMHDGVVLGSDGNIWFTEDTHVASITPGGAVSEYPIPLPNGLIFNSVSSITAVDQRVWFPINNDNQPPYNGYIASISPKTKKIVEYPVPCFDPVPVVGALNGDIYAACRTVNSTTVNIVQMTPAGATTVFSNPLGVSAFGGSAMIAEHAAIWFITFDGGAHPLSLGGFSLQSHQVADFPTPSGLGGLAALSAPPRSAGVSGYVYALGGGSNPVMGQFHLIP